MPCRFVLLLPFFLLFFTPAFADERSCANLSAVIVNTDDKEAFAEICAATEEALAFLARYDLKPKAPISIEIVEKKIENHGYAAYGSYYSEGDHISLMSYAAIFATSEHPQMYGEPFDRVHYAGVIAHEVTHSVVRHYIKDERFSMVPQEYLAHVVQLATMPETRRNAIIRAMNVGPWEGGDSISNIYMAMNPGKFAVKSYLHLMSLAETSSFIQILLNNNWFYVNVPKSK